MSSFETDRRSLFGVGAALAGVGLVAAPGAAQGTSPTGWRPTNDAADDWMERPGARHRLVFDTTTAEAGSGAMDYAMNFIHANEVGYGLKPQDLGVIIVLRHMSTPYGFGNASWKKYGRQIARSLELKGEEAIDGATMNPLLVKPTGSPPKGAEWAWGAPLTLLAEKGGMFAVCELATQGMAMQLASKTGGNAKAIEAELKADLVPGAHMVPAGIVAVNRAQERGYAFAYVS